MTGARFDFPESDALAQVVLQYGHIATEGARIHADEIQSLLVESDEPADPGGPPHTSGRLRDSFFSGRAKRRGLRVVAYTSSLLMAGEIPLPVLLDQGWDDGDPFPFLDQAEMSAERLLDALVARESPRR